LLHARAEVLFGSIQVSEEALCLASALIRVGEDLGQPDLVHQSVDTLLLDAELLLPAPHREEGRMDLPEERLRDDAVGDDRECLVVDPQGLLDGAGPK
jgi:hypothetical protein